MFPAPFFLPFLRGDDIIYLLFHIGNEPLAGQKETI